MVSYGARIFAVVAALLVGVIFVLTVRTAGLHEIAARSNCDQASSEISNRSNPAGVSRKAAMNFWPGRMG